MKLTEQLNAINDMLRELEDVKNNQACLLQKVTQFEMESVCITGNFLQKEINCVQQQASENYKILTQLIAQLKLRRNNFLTRYNRDIM
jgi:hypothetical protein